MSREPLTPEEQAVAQRLRAWPAGEPSAELDGRILAQSRAAVATPRPRRRPMLVGFASAAALVLTVGMVWRVAQEPAHDALMQAPAPEMRAAGPERHDNAERVESAPSAAADVARLSIPASTDGDELRHDEAERLASPPPAARASSDMVVRRRQEGAEQRAKTRASAAQAPSPPAPAPAPAQPAPAPAPRAFPQTPPPPAEPAPISESVAPERRAIAPEPTAGAAPRLEQIEQAGGRLELADGAEFDDAVAQIRALIERGDDAGARTAIRRLRERFPDRTLPPDLLRAERAARRH